MHEPGVGLVALAPEIAAIGHVEERRTRGTGAVPLQARAVDDGDQADLRDAHRARGERIADRLVLREPAGGLVLPGRVPQQHIHRLQAARASGRERDGQVEHFALVRREQLLVQAPSVPGSGQVMIIANSTPAAMMGPRSRGWGFMAMLQAWPILLVRGTPHGRV